MSNRTPSNKETQSTPWRHLHNQRNSPRLLRPGRKRSNSVYSSECSTRRTEDNSRKVPDIPARCSHQLNLVLLGRPFHGISGTTDNLQIHTMRSYFTLQMLLELRVDSFFRTLNRTRRSPSPRNLQMRERTNIKEEV